MAIRLYDETFYSGVGYIMSSNTNQTIAQCARHDTINNQTKPIRMFSLHALTHSQLTHCTA